MTAPHASPDITARPPVVGVFDSGIGGLSVLREIRAQLPSVDLHYVADSGYAPYGERGEDYVSARSLRIARHLVDHGAVVLVVACNTATAAAVQTLRLTWPRLAVVGVEPGIKPAIAATRNGRIGVLATPGTLASEKFRRLLQSQAGDTRVLPQPCPGLASLIERGDFESPDIRQALHAFCAPLRAAEVDTVVLGCTHYAFVRTMIEAELGPAVRIVDTAEAVARRAAQLFAEAAVPPRPKEHGRLRVETTGEPAGVRDAVAAMCGQAVLVEHVDLRPVESTLKP